MLQLILSVHILDQADCKIFVLCYVFGIQIARDNKANCNTYISYYMLSWYDLIINLKNMAI